MTRSYVGQSLLESVQYHLRPGFVEDFAIFFFLALLLDIPSSIGTKINLLNAELFATGDAYTHHSAETFLLGAISQ